MTPDELRVMLDGRVAVFNHDLTNGWAIFREQTKELDILHDKLLRIEGAKVFAESILTTIVSDTSKKDTK